MPRKNSAKNPIGPGKKGTLKRMAYKQGVGKKGLATLRSLSGPQKKLVKAGSGTLGGLKKTIANVRTSRSAAGASMTRGGGLKKGAAGQRQITLPVDGKLTHGTDRMLKGPSPKVKKAPSGKVRQNVLRRVTKKAPGRKTSKARGSF